MGKEQIRKDVLLVTNVWTGAAPFFYEGQEKSKGMPAFNNVFYKILDDDRIGTIHVIVWQPEYVISIPPKYNKKIQIYTVGERSTNLFQKFKLIYTAVSLGVRIVQNNSNIQQLVGFGSLGGVTALISRKTSVPEFRRLYGTFLINEISEPKWKLFLKHPLEYLTFSMKGKGLIITNDGTKGDIVFEKIGNKDLPLHFLLNGVDKNIATNIKRPKNISLPDNFMTYVARLDPWKSQHLLIEALHCIHTKGLDFPVTYIIGAAWDKEYVARLSMMVNKFGLEDKIKFIYGLPIQEVHYMLLHSDITFSLYHTSNLGNVFIEAVQLGVPMIALNDTGSLDLIDLNAFFEIKSNKIEVIEDAILNLLENDELRHQISENAKKFANRTFLSWEERAKREIDLIIE
ncbi:glycosyltransferase family 4 protein [Sphingobacterium faecale]|uniref:Glycosyltransferase family 4 protein n=1 Tax=Sphingobacterium faecale TaxID=2803775 RepID=A0ABS1R6L1_9SPHI|nr:glycosyltransferase family 4 protein [Sphingobacterium faecale]MBL1410342.1 glycosyltransferase family 4 protein [Sphingobacterium faecale]